MAAAFAGGHWLRHLEPGTLASAEVWREKKCCGAHDRVSAGDGAAFRGGLTRPRRRSSQAQSASFIRRAGTCPAVMRYVRHELEGSLELTASSLGCGQGFAALRKCNEF